MKAISVCALACASMALAGCPQAMQAGQSAAPPQRMGAARAMSPLPSTTLAASGVTLTLDSVPVSAVISQGDTFAATMSGTWQATAAGSVYLQVSDSAGLFVAPAPMLASSKRPSYAIGLGLPTSTTSGVYTGTLSVRACEDRLCTQPYAGTSHSVGYTVTVNKVGEWETLQRTPRHDGYVPITIDATRYHVAWSFENTASNSPLSAVVTDGNNVYFAEPDSVSTRLGSIYAKRATDGVLQWQKALTRGVNPPTASNGVVYVSEGAWVHALRASDGLELYQSQFATQLGTILNPTVCNGKVYLNAGAYGGVVYAFNIADGSAAWNVSGGTYGMNTPAADDRFVYAYNGGTLAVFNVADGSLATSIGPNPDGLQDNYDATPMLGSTDHVLASIGRSFHQKNRQLLDYSVSGQTVRWRSLALYNPYPAVAKGAVYATSNESHTFDALDEATGRRLWSWKPPEPSFNFIGNVVVTDNVAFASTNTRVYAIDLHRHHAVWSAPTPGSLSLSANRMLFVSKIPETDIGRSLITAYGLN